MRKVVRAINNGGEGESECVRYSSIAYPLLRGSVGTGEDRLGGCFLRRLIEEWSLSILPWWARGLRNPLDRKKENTL